jgi:CHAT domain-containing protein/tetratricopeptide (TPR) repeat protein
MTHAANRTCPGPETLAAFADGRLKGAQSMAVVEHLDTCDECTRDVALGMQTAAEENVIRPRRWMPWLAAAAAAVLLPVLLFQTLDRSPVERLAALAPKTARIIEPRLAGGFAWAPYRGSERSTGNATDAARLKLGGEAGEVIERAEHDASADAQHDAGVAMVLTQNPAEGIARLETAAKLAPSAMAWNDLAAARYTASSDLGRTALYPQALAAADAALRLDPGFPEALFNRALILERMGLVAEARRAWERYLAVDPSSKWADEARAHLAELPAATTSSRFEHDRPLLENAAARGDAATVRTLVAANTARARAFAETEYLGRWGEAVLQKNEVDAARWLTIARAIGTALDGDAEESLLHDAVQVVDDTPQQQRERIAAAHAAYRSGRIAYSRQDLAKALEDLDRAGRGFAEAGSPMALAARYYIAGVRQARNDAGARAELERLFGELQARSGYVALRAHVGWELARARMFDYDWSGATAILSASAAAFRRAGDRTSEAVVESLAAQCLRAEGRGDAAWISHIAAFRAHSEEGNAMRLANAIDGAMRVELLAGRNDAALALSRVSQPAAANAAQLPVVLDALVTQSMLESITGAASDALRTASEAASLAQGISDPALRARRLADIDVATGAAIAISNPASASASLTRAIDFYRRSDLPFALPEPLLLRSRCSYRTGSNDAAARDLEEGMAIVARSRARGAGVAIGTGILDADHALFADSIRSSLDRGDNSTAFGTAERSRGDSLSVAELQRRLAGSATALLEIVALPEEVVTFAVAENDFVVGRRPRASTTLTASADASLSENGTTAAAALYDDVIRPVDAVVRRARALVIVPDPRLERAPFAALYDTTTRMYLVERVGVAIASSAASLQREDRRDAASIVAMTLPSGGATGTAALPQVERELAEITALYPRANAIPSDRATLSALRDAMASADVVHLSGHTERQLAGGEYALLLTDARGSGVERVSSKMIGTIAASRARLIVLAACESLRPPASPETHALSLGGAFAAAGAHSVIGTLMPIGDRDARTFFRELHRHLAAGEDASDALRAAQRSAIRNQKEHGDSPGWRSIALVTNRIHASREKESS